MPFPQPFDTSLLELAARSESNGRTIAALQLYRERRESSRATPPFTLIRVHYSVPAEMVTKVTYVRAMESILGDVAGDPAPASRCLP
jgi:hypothetical protein